MDKTQESKYWALFWSYRAASEPIAELVRDAVVSNLHKENFAPLRGDAAFFLLLNFDQMIGAVYSEPFRPPGGYPSSESLAKPGPQVLKNVSYALDKIFDKLYERQPTDPFGYSSHNVMRSIDEVWGDLVPLFAWA
ncbi:hypothetical protein [Cupriavidus lacunae]|uniref:hypothetical protein n=1 Tax=Cupriavidus lacunae TaxID=2666307 RepID=UPI00105910F2|nr:hypothetical protein [Cupriavidus lacunae]